MTGKATLASLFLALVLSARGAAGIELSRMELDGKRYVVCRVEIQAENLQLAHRDDAGKPFRRFDRLAAWLRTRGERLVFGMNAGMFHQDLSTVGLFVADGRERAPLNSADGEGNFFLKPNGVFAVTGDGARILETSEYPGLVGKVILATQSGPLLVRGGKIHAAFKPGSESRTIRNGVGVPARGQAIFVISEDRVNFHELARLFRDTLHCPDALYLDGAISSLFAPELGRNDSLTDLGPILAVTEKIAPHSLEDPRKR
jgi:uncharacterized protein YigE (DUF2233 family)